MNYQDSFQKLVNHLFLAMRRPAPALEHGACVDLVLANGATIQIHLADANVTLSTSTPLHRGYSADFLLELLQINLNVDAVHSIVVSALAAEELIVVWGKESLSALTPEGFVEYFDRFCHHVDVITRHNVAKPRDKQTSAASDLSKSLLTQQSITLK